MQHYYNNHHKVYNIVYNHLVLLCHKMDRQCSVTWKVEKNIQEINVETITEKVY